LHGFSEVPRWPSVPGGRGDDATANRTAGIDASTGAEDGRVYCPSVGIVLTQIFRTGRSSWVSPPWTCIISVVVNSDIVFPIAVVVVARLLVKRPPGRNLARFPQRFLFAWLDDAGDSSALAGWFWVGSHCQSGGAVGTLGLRLARVPIGASSPEPKTPPLAAAPLTDADADVKRIAALPAAEQVEDIRRELIRRNPGFDGKVEHKIEDGVVTELRFVTDQVSIKGDSTSKVECADEAGNGFDSESTRNLRLHGPTLDLVSENGP
jgi:hypothetical protein